MSHGIWNLTSSESILIAYGVYFDSLTAVLAVPQLLYNLSSIKIKSDLGKLLSRNYGWMTFQHKKYVHFTGSFECLLETFYLFG